MSECIGILGKLFGHDWINITDGDSHEYHKPIIGYICNRCKETRWL